MENYQYKVHLEKRSDPEGGAREPLEVFKLLRELPILRSFCLKFSDSFTCRKLKVKFSQCSLSTF